MTIRDRFPASFYGEAGMLGLLANGISALLVLLQNFNEARSGIPAEGMEHILAGVHLILIGGVCQLLAGLLSFRKYDHLSGTSFIGYAALWSSYGATRIFLGGSIPLPGNLSLAKDLNASLGCPEWLSPPISQSAIAGLIPYILLSFILAFCSATVNYIMPCVFGAITGTLVFEAIGLVGRWGLVVSGMLELLIFFFAIYGSVILLIKGVSQRYVLKGFGSPLFNVLLLGTTDSSSSQRQEKKNTQYAEPIALGLFCDTISPFVFAFYCFGYVPSFTVGAVWVSINSGAQLLSSYYSYLRQDCYYATKFGLHCTYWLVKSWEEFVLSFLMDGKVPAGAREAMVGDWFFLAAGMILCLLSLNMDTLELLHNSLFLLLTVSTISQIPLQGYYAFFGLTCSLFTTLSLYGTFARLVNTIAEKPLIFVGPQTMSMDRLLRALSVLKCCMSRAWQQDASRHTASELPDALFYLTNGLAALSAIHTSQPNPAYLRLTMPWVLISGVVIQAYVSRLQVQGGRRFGSVIPLLYAAIWAIWTWYRFAGHALGIPAGSAYAFTAGAIVFLAVNGFIMVVATYMNLVLLTLTTVMEVMLVCLLLSTIGRLPYQLEISMLAIFSIICLYGALASMTNFIFSKDLIPTGSSVFMDEKKKREETPPLPCPIAESRLTSGLLRISKLLDQSGVCGIPTDTVYALAASCKKPKAIEKIYNIKNRPAEKPICICIGSVEQLMAAKPPFSSLLWEFMKNVYPGGISCIVPKGVWLFKLGVGPAYDCVGTEDSIMIRVPDHTVTVHLCEITGPLAITSANPSGEPDSTHHDMVVMRLGHKIQGVLCDGESNEVVASTVVNCLNIDKGTINILREGCVPAAKVRDIFERVKNSIHV